MWEQEKDFKSQSCTSGPPVLTTPPSWPESFPLPSSWRLPYLWFGGNEVSYLFLMVHQLVLSNSTVLPLTTLMLHGFVAHTCLNHIICLPYACLLCQLDKTSFWIGLLCFISQSKEWLHIIWCSVGRANIIWPVCSWIQSHNKRYHMGNRLESSKTVSILTSNLKQNWKSGSIGFPNGKFLYS